MNIRHKMLLPAAFVAALSLSLASCGKGEDVIEAAATDNALLAYVPADTPYLMGNLEAIPNEVIEANFRRAQPALDAMQEVLAGSRVKLSGSAAQDNPEIAIMGALLGELDGKLSREGLESLGLSMDAYQVIYGMGAFPVIRVTLSDAQALRAAIGRIEASSGLEFAEQALQEQSYWNLTANVPDDDLPFGMYLAIVEQEEGAHLAFSLFPATAEAELLPVFLGQEKPAENTAALRLAEINNQYGYDGYGSGVMDFERLFDQYVNPNTLVHRLLLEHGVDPSGELDAVCQAEIRGLIARAPRMVAGITDLTPSVVGVQYRLEMAGDLASELAALVSNVPAAPAQTDRLLEFAFGIRVGAARDFLIRKATALSQETYQCEALQNIPDTASEALVKLNTPMPPLVNNFLGLRASLSSLPEDESDLGDIRGTMALHVDKPEMFVGMAKMLLPQMEEIQLTKGEPPVRLPESLIPAPGIVAHAAMSDTAIGIAVGEGEESRLAGFLETRAANDGSFLSANYDMATYMDRIEKLTDEMYDDALQDHERMQRESGENGGVSDADRVQAREMAEAIQQTIRNMAGRSYFSLRFDEAGFAVDSRMEFKN